MKFFKKMLTICVAVLMIIFMGCNASKEATSNQNINSTVLSKQKQDITSNKSDGVKVEKNNSKVKENIKKSENKVVKADNKSEKKQNLKEKTENNSKNNETKEVFTLIISRDKKGYTGKAPVIYVEKEVEIKGKKNAMTYLRENADIKEKGGFIYEINGIHNLYPIPSDQLTEDQKKNKVLGIDWFIYLNGKKTPVGANDIYPKKGDVLMFDIHEWDKREFLPPTD